MKSCPYCGGQYPDDVVICAIDHRELEDLKESPQTTKSTPVLSVLCPACGVSDDYTPVVELRGSFSWGTYLAGGLFGVLFQNAG